MSGASTLRNAVKRVTHKERAQPSDRKRFGLLEKHGDYIERARDYQRKQNYLSSLRKKAAERNPDEFYFHMHNSRVVNGKHVELDKSKAHLDKETVDLLKGQDMGYIVYKKSIDEKRVARLRENMHLIGDVAPKRHTVFVDSSEDLDNFDAAKHFNTAPELVERAYNRPRLAQLEEWAEKRPENLHEVVQASVAEKASAKKKKRKSKELVELRERAKRADRLKRAMQELHVQRSLSTSRGTTRKLTLTQVVGKDQKEKEVTVYKWKRQRTK